MPKAVGPALGLAALALAAFDSAASAQDTVRVRGTIDRVDGPIYVVKARDGAELKISLAENGVVLRPRWTDTQRLGTITGAGLFFAPPDGRVVITPFVYALSAAGRPI